MTANEAIIWSILMLIVGILLGVVAIISTYFDQPTIEATCNRTFSDSSGQCQKLVEQLENYPTKGK